MSLVPLIFSNWWEELEKPHRLFDQNFGIDLNLDDLVDALPSSDQILVYRPSRRSLRRRYRPYYDARRSETGTSVVEADKDKFKVTLGVQQFLPNEINVKVVDRNIIVEAKHEEKEDEHGWISREFTRKYIIPEQCDPDKVESSLSSDGVLTIQAPRKQEQIHSNERRVQIQFTGRPAIREESIANGSAQLTEKQSQKVQNTPQRGRKATSKTT